MLIHIWGEYGLYTRPDFASDRVSYLVPPFSTLSGLLESFFWKRGVYWEIDRVFVLSEVRHLQIMRNERQTNEGGKRTQRRALFVKAPNYVVQASPRSLDYEQAGKALAMAARWLRQGRTRSSLFLGTRECMAYVGPPPADFRALAVSVNRDMPPIGRMPTSVLYDERGTPIGTEWGDYVYDPTTGAYFVAQRRVVRTGACAAEQSL